MKSNLITIVFPFCDLRPLVNKPSHKLQSPNWLLPDPEKNFIKYSGALRYRKEGNPEESLLDEDMFYQTHNLVRLPKFENFSDPQNKICAREIQVLRRFFSDGKLVNRVEISFLFNIGVKKRFDEATDQELLDSFFEQILEKFLNFPACIGKVGKDNKTTPLYKLGAKLTPKYMEATTEKNFSAYEKWWVAAGEPMLFVSTDEKKIPGFINLNAVPIEDFKEKNLDMYHSNFILKNKRIKCWYGIRVDNFNDYSAFRNLRLNLIRLHTERECLKVTLRSILTKKLKLEKDSPQSNVFQTYLNNSLGFMMSQKSKQQISKLKFTKYALKLDSVSNSSDTDKILRSLEFIRKNVLFKLKNLFTLQSDKDNPEQEVRAVNIENIRNKLKGFIAKAHLGEVINFMLKYGKKGEVMDAVSIISASFEKLKNDNKRGLVTSEEFNIGFNDLNYKIINFIKSFEPDENIDAMMLRLNEIQQAG